jgi:hypothetical protein
MPFVIYLHDPAHSFGSVSAQGTTVDLIRRYSCPACLKQFQNERELAEHLAAEHPIHLPYLTLAGRQVPSVWTVRRPLSQSLAAVNANKIHVDFNNKRIRNGSASVISRLLTDYREGVVDIRLTNRTVDSTYQILLRVPEPKEVDEITTAFATQLARNDVSVPDVRRFAERPSLSQAGLEYASALADYVFGVLAKDQSGGISLPFSAFRQKFLTAESVLCEFDNTLAGAICAAIRFNLNDFAGPVRLTGVEPLDRATEFFAEKAGADGVVRQKRGRSKQTSPTPRPLCPIDSATERIVRATTDGRPVEDLPVPPDLSDEDRTKSAVVIADDRIRRRRATDAIVYLEQLQHDPVFGEWALRLLSTNR